MSLPWVLQFLSDPWHLTIGVKAESNIGVLMKFKWLSGDFVSDYNRHIDELRAQQAELDEKYEKIMSEVVEREAERLAKTVPVEYEAGTRVVNSYGNVGIIQGSHIELNVKTYAKSDIDQEVVGPNKYWNIRNSEEENVVTCEGMLRRYDVKFDAHDLAKDWGVDQEVFTMYPDEFEIAKEEQ